MGLDILLIPSRQYNPCPLSTLLNLCIKNDDILVYFGNFYPETKRKDFYSLGTRKETTLKKEDIYVSGNIWEQKEETKVKEMETSRKYLKFKERKSCFLYICIKANYNS